MLWFAVWFLLVAGTIVGAVLLGISLWRKAKALLVQFEHTTQAVEALERKVAELEAAREQYSYQPTLVATDEQRQRWRQMLATNKLARAQRRTVRHARAHARWSDIVG